MTDLKPYADLLARLLLAAIFILSGLQKLGSIDGTMGYMQAMNVPGILIWPTIAVEVLGGIAILVGYQTRIAAFLLAGFTLIAGFLFHYVPADQMQMIMFMKNLSITGGLLLLVVHGAGALSVERWLSAKATA